MEASKTKTKKRSKTKKKKKGQSSLNSAASMYYRKFPPAKYSYKMIKKNGTFHKKSGHSKKIRDCPVKNGTFGQPCNALVSTQTSQCRHFGSFACKC